MVHDVFISYSHEDKPVADAACAVLERHGVRCWIAPRDVTLGMSYGEAIMDAIADARIMVLIFSDHANKSPQVEREIERAVGKGRWLIPIRIEDVAPRKSLEYFISTSHWLDALTPPMEQHFERLADAVRKLLQSPDNQAADSGPRTTKNPAPEAVSVNQFVGAPTLTQGTTAASTPRWRQPKTIAIATAASVLVAVVAVGGYLVGGQTSPGPAASQPASAPAPISTAPAAPAFTSATPTMSGHYLKTSTEPSSGKSTAAADWYFTPCGDGCASLALTPGGQPYAQARLVNGQWAMDMKSDAFCADASTVPLANAAHYTWDPNTLAGTARDTQLLPACGYPAGYQYTNTIQLRQAP
jgi:hypothetical protein